MADRGCNGGLAPLPSLPHWRGSVMGPECRRHFRVTSHGLQFSETAKAKPSCGVTTPNLLTAVSAPSGPELLYNSIGPYLSQNPLRDVTARIAAGNANVRPSLNSGMLLLVLAAAVSRISTAAMSGVTAGFKVTARRRIFRHPLRVRIMPSFTRRQPRRVQM